MVARSLKSYSQTLLLYRIHKCCVNSVTGVFWALELAKSHRMLLSTFFEGIIWFTSTRVSPHLTPDQYLEIERAAEFRSEYLDGAMCAMNGPFRRHSRPVPGGFRLLRRRFLVPFVSSHALLEWFCPSVRESLLFYEKWDLRRAPGQTTRRVRGSCEIKSIDCRLLLKDVYERVEFEAAN